MLKQSARALAFPAFDAAVVVNGVSTPTSAARGSNPGRARRSSPGITTSKVGPGHPGFCAGEAGPKTL